MAVLQAQEWPGNARQLRNSLERLLILMKDQQPADGVITASGSPASSSTRSASIMALSTKAEPVSRWHQRQWQQCTNNGSEVMR